MNILTHNRYLVIESFDGGKEWEYPFGYKFHDKKADAIKEMESWKVHHPEVLYRVLRYQPKIH